MAKQATQEVLEFPSGGIADFYMEDHEIEALEAEEAEEAFGSAGIATFEPIAHRMASYGRHGDDTVAHVETGELVIPKALIEDNPRLRASIFSHLEELGVEDPERYVVGSGANSINPDTGLPEFFFKKIRKAVSKIGRGVKKAFKSVAKVIKKAAPVIIPFALNAMFPGLGAIYSGALGSGIGTLVQGGSLKDAFKSALIGGAIGGATAAIGGGMSAAKTGGSFSEGAVSGLKNAAKVSNLTTAGKQLVSGQFGQSGLDAVNVSSDAFAANYPDYGTAPDAVSDIKAQATDMGQTKFIEGTNIPNQGQSVVDLQNQAMAPRPEGLTNANLTVDASGNLKLAPSSSSFDMSTAVDLPTKPPGFFESVKGALTPGDNVGFLEGMGDAFFPSQNMTATELMKANPGMTVDQAKQAIADASPSFLRSALPGTVVAGIGTVAGLNKMGGDPEDDPTTEDLQEQLGPTGEDLIAQNPGQYLITGNTEVPVGSTGQYVVPTDFAYAGQNYYNQTPFLRARGLGGTPFVQQAAEGGQIFPRRVGGIMPNEGVPGQDSVRAMLMPGEFVMTTDAVRGLGNGNNEQGINRMYDMMRGLEAKGKAMA